MMQKDIKVGMVIKSNNCGYYEVLKKEKNKALIKFLNTGYERYAFLIAMTKGNVKDLLAPTLCNIGIIGIGNYKTTIKNKATKEYLIWKCMIERCYHKNDKSYYNYGEKGVIVDKRWHNFQNFCEDIQHLENYDKWKFNHGWELDKDLKQKGVINKIYSKDTCIFLTSEEQNILAHGEPVIAYIEGIKFKKFKTIASASKETNINASSISECCRKISHYAGIINGNKVVWRYSTDTSDLDIIDKCSKPVIGYVNNIKCFDFKSISDAIKNTNASFKGISKCCKKTGKYSGNYNGDKITWRYKGDTL